MVIFNKKQKIKRQEFKISYLKSRNSRPSLTFRINTSEKNPRLFSKYTLIYLFVFFMKKQIAIKTKQLTKRTVGQSFIECKSNNTYLINRYSKNRITIDNNADCLQFLFFTEHLNKSELTFLF